MLASIENSNVSDSTKDLLISRLRQPAEKDNVQIAKSSQTQSLPVLAKGSTSDAALASQKSIATVDIMQHKFVHPRKRIVSQHSLSRFQQSDAFQEILAFIEQCNGCIVGKTLEDDVAISPAASAILSVLDQIQQVRHETPSDSSDSASRFGNPAFRTFYDNIKQRNDELHRMIPGLSQDSCRAAREELSVYLQESWGNQKRIDYGSGMELNFAFWLLCLCKLGILQLPQDGPAIVLKIFWKYIQIMRDIQSTYWLEPAGSHGVWGLDDYHFLPFLWGAGQLSNHKHLRPKAIHDHEVTSEFAPKFMYFACIQFINSVKTASLRWHSPMLDDISGVKTWSKVNEGMVKMYKAEVLLKLPIAQHIFFGSLLTFPEPAPGQEDDDEAQEDEHGHIHPARHGMGEGQAAGWGDCCGIPIPSVFAAAQEEKKKQQGGSAVARGEQRFGSNVRRIPFD